MTLGSIIGNEKVVRRLMKAVEANNISHAYLFEGNGLVDKLQISENFVKAILCLSPSGGDSCELCSSCKKINHGNHEDLIYLRAEGSSIKDEVVFQLQGRLGKKPYMGIRNVAIIENADTMTLRAQNRLLKTLEEPWPGTIIILLSENMENLTQTILSRCVIYKLNPLHMGENTNITDKAIHIAQMLLRRKAFYEIVKKMDEYTATKEAAYQLLDVLETWYRDVLLFEFDIHQGSDILYYQGRLTEIEEQSRIFQRERIYSAVENIEEARNLLNRNMNIGYTLKNMILKIIA